MKPLVIYHNNCTDGFGAAYAAWMRYKKAGADYVALDYLKNDATVGDFKAKLIDHPLLDREVYILDFSFPKVIMDWLFQNCLRVVWLDHHKAAFEMWCGEYKKGDVFEPTPGTRYDESSNYILLDDNHSGAWLAWDYFNNPHKKHPVPPTLFMLIDDRDRWVFAKTGSREAHAALQAMRPWSFFQWSTLSIPDLLDLGTKLMTYQTAQINEAIERARVCRIPIPVPNCPDYYLTGLAANSTVHFSEIGHELYNRSGKTFGMVWSVDADNVVWCNLRSADDGLDVSAIAKAHGGGGHRNSAGFKTRLAQLMAWLS